MLQFFGVIITKFKQYLKVIINIFRGSIVVDEYSSPQFCAVYVIPVQLFFSTLNLFYWQHGGLKNDHQGAIWKM